MTDSDQPPRPPDRTMTWWPIVGALVIAAIVAVVIFAVGAGDDNRTGSRIDDDGALSCPTTSSGSAANAAQQVPAEPSGVDGTHHLVPDTLPRFVVVCEYAAPDEDAPGKGFDTRRLGRVVLTANTRAAARQLHRAPKDEGGRACPQFIARPGKPSYLIGFTFDTGIAWVWVPGEHCSSATNGQFSTADDLVTPVAKAYTIKRWP